MEKKITIGLFIDTFFPMIDGVVMVVDNYARRLSKVANVIVFAPKISKKFNDKILPYKVVRCRAIKVPFLDYSLPLPHIDRKFRKQLNEYKLDIVHIHSPASIGAMGVWYARKYNTLLIGTMHSQYKQDLKRAIKSDITSNILTKKITKIYNKCDEVWTVNNEIARIFKEEYGYKKEPRVVYNATEMKPVDNKKDARKIINEIYDLNDKDKVLLFVGRINKLKNIFFIVDALKILDRQNFDFKMLFVGSGQDEDALKEYIKENNLEEKIILCGKVTNRQLLACYYERADLFLFPSLYDCNSIVQIEAACQKTPSLFLNGAVTADTVEDNKNGFLADSDPALYADKIIEIFNDSKLYNKVCKNAYKSLYINWDNSIKEVYDLYLDLIKKR